jgi:secreted trypsin-like serine protease
MLLYNSIIVLCLALPAAVLARAPAGLIVGGSESSEGAWPWQLSLRYLGSHSCGASLVGARLAVCAAHCVGAIVTTYTIVAGTNQRSCGDGNCVTRIPNTAERHPNYTDSGVLGYPNDLSLITWTDPIAEVAGKIQFVVLASTEDQVGQECYITGWGRLSGGGTIPENLQEALIDVITTVECQTLWSATSVHDTHVCVYDTATQLRGACNGDSGGPLVCRRSPTDQWELVGATSWGRTGCSTDYPSVYTRISSYRDWILGQIPRSLL